MSAPRMASTVCPCCGGAAPGSDLRWFPQDGVLVGRGSTVYMTVREAQIFDVLWKARTEHYALSTAEIASRAFSNDSNAPNCEMDSVNIYRIKLRKKIRPVGLEIRKTGNSSCPEGPGCQGTFRLLNSDGIPTPKWAHIQTRPESPSMVARMSKSQR